MVLNWATMDIFNSYEEDSESKEHEFQAKSWSTKEQNSQFRVSLVTLPWSM
jgi:hypothetical protein